MPRMRRLVFTDGEASYLVSNRLGGQPEDQVLADPKASGLLQEVLDKYLRVYAIRCTACRILEDGLRLQLEINPQRRLSRRELYRRARLLWENPQEKLKTAGQRRAFRRRLTSLSDFMRDVEAGWTRAYNRLRGRRGPMWSGRFHSTLLGGAAVGWATQFVRGPSLPALGATANGEAASGWDRSWHRRRWRELVSVWEWVRVVGDLPLVRWCARQDRDRFPWVVAPLVPGLWTLVEPRFACRLGLAA